MTDKSSLPLPLEVLNQGVIDNNVGDRFGGRGLAAGVAGWLSIAIVDIDPETGICHTAFAVEKEHLMFTGHLHGACITALIDTSLPLTVYPFVPIGSVVFVGHMGVDYLSSVTEGICDAYTTIESLGSSTAVLRTKVENKGRLVALGNGTCHIKNFDNRSKLTTDS